MLNEKNPLASQALSDDDLDGVVGGNSGTCQNPDGTFTFNGVTYNSLSDMPSDVKSEYKLYIAGYTQSLISNSFRTCPRCGKSGSSKNFVEVSGHGRVCSECAWRLQPRSVVESHSSPN